MCPIIATLTPLVAYISLSADYSTISVDTSVVMQPTDYGTHLFTLTVNSANFSSSVLQQNYNFNVIIACIVTSLAVTSQASDTIYTLN